MNEANVRILANYYANKKCNKQSLAKQYHINSKLSTVLTEESIIQASSLVMNKTFSQAIRNSEKNYPLCEKISLPKVEKIEDSLYNCIIRRKSHNTKTDNIKLTLNDISTLCWAAYGIIDSKNIRRSVPSAGALYPCEIYMLSVDSEIPHGLYHYSSFKHQLETMRSEKINLETLFTSTIGLEHASIVFVITAIFDRAFFKYGERAYRFIMIEIGEIVQNISLAATALGYDATAHGGTADYELEDFIKIDGTSESVLIGIGIS